MLAQLFIWPLFAASCGAALIRPWLGVVAFYFFVVLDPGWNWRWSLPRDFSFQLYMGLSVALGWAINGFPGTYPSGKGWLPHIGLLVYLALAYVSSTQTINEPLSSYYMSMIWKIVVMAIVAAFVIDTPQKVFVLITAVVIAQGYNALQINLQYLEDGFSLFVRGGWASGTKGDNNGYTIFTLPLLAMSLSLCATKHALWLRLMALAVAILQVHQTMLLESRGGMLGVALLVALVVCFVPKTTFNVTVFTSAIIVGLVLAGPPVVKEFSSIFVPRDEMDSSAASRFLLWKAGAEITTDYPLLGVGPWAGSMLVPEYYEGRIDGNRKELHNLVFELTTGSGIPATIAYLAFLLLPWWWCTRLILDRRTRRELEPSLHCASLAVACGMPAYLLASMFSSGSLLESTYVLALTGCATAVMTGLASAGRDACDDVDEDEDSSLAIPETSADFADVPFDECWSADYGLHPLMGRD